MADDAWHFAVTVPAGTPASAPVTVTTRLPPCVVESVHWRMPPGANGLVGFQVSMRGVPVIPAGDGAFIVDSASSGSWPLSEFPDSGDWSVTAYNTGAFPHTIHITHLVRYRKPQPARLELASLAELTEWPAGDAPVYVPGLWG